MLVSVLEEEEEEEGCPSVPFCPLKGKGERGVCVSDARRKGGGEKEEEGCIFWRAWIDGRTDGENEEGKKMKTDLSFLKRRMSGEMNEWDFLFSSLQLH